ncbi:MAG: nucleoside deaminase [Bacteroidales bacterium]|nr:nucleoside deaminase [Bacteroidales bacterium]
MENTDEKYMREALKEAQQAFNEGEIPVGAVIVSQGKILARAHNLTQRLNDPTAHAEMQAITSATHAIGGKYLTDCTLYVTLEPCVMCAGALFWAQIERLVYGASDPKRGYKLVEKSLLHPKTTVESDVLEKECANLLTDFFKKKR